MGSNAKRSINGGFRRFRLGRPWCEAIELANGRKLIVRPIEPADAIMLTKSFGYLTPEEIRFRFLHPLRELTPDYARSLTRLDHDRSFALVVVEAVPPKQALIGAVGRVTIDEQMPEAEFAIIVGREISGFGLGTYLLKKLVEWCRKKKLELIYGHVMMENKPMLNLARKLGFKLRMEASNPGLVRVEKRLNQDSRPTSRSNPISLPDGLPG
ncbi:MAG: GNAT family N-acetyltransferase [Wenzhouxiangellaceae bacterium]|nr:GNAT family N-acetyltransferase [Wenzhouxiangellaceae bacterium]